MFFHPPNRRVSSPATIHIPPPNYPLGANRCEKSLTGGPFEITMSVPYIAAVRLEDVFGE
jgi:hypothetical protein